MTIKVETEEKYYCLNLKRMIEIVKSLNFNEIKSKTESDEYFTDIDSKFIENRTCLRIRKTNDSNMEITYKGKSNSLLGQYCKLENNITANIEEYSNFVSLFSSLGYYSYAIVQKERLTFEKTDDEYRYSIMIDSLPEIGGFVEFEIISEQESSTKEKLNQALRKFISNFSELNLKEETRPYRDVVAQYIYKKNTPKNKTTDLYINLDNELLNYEKNFFKMYKEELCLKTGLNIKWGNYKNDSRINAILAPLIDEYIDNLIFDSKGILVATELLKKFDYKIHYITKVNEIFFTHFFGKLNIKIADVIYISNDNLSQTFRKNKVDLSSSIVMSNKIINEIISILLIIINNN